MNAAQVLSYFDQISEAADAVPRLRRFILDLAVRGKLVLQDPTDEPALEYLRRSPETQGFGRIDGRGRRPAAGGGEALEEPYELPRNWAWLRFGEIHYLVRGVTYSKSDASEEPAPDHLPVLRANNIGVSLNFDKLVFVKKGRISKDQMLRRGDYLIALSSGSKNLVGKAAHVERDYEAGFGGFCGVIRLCSKDIEPFVGVYLASRLYRDAISAGSRGIGINNLQTETLRRIPFPLPPLAEQRRIVARVDELMVLCDRLEAARAEREATRNRLTTASLLRLNAPDPDAAKFTGHARFALDNLAALAKRPDQIKQLRQTIHNLAVRGLLVSQDLTDEPVRNVPLKIIVKGRGQIRESIEQPFGLPSRWAWRAVDTIADQVTDGEHATPPRVADAQVPLVTAKNVRDGFMDYAQTDWVSRSTAEKAWGRCRPTVGDLLLVCVGATTGRLTVLRQPRDMVLVRSVALIRPNREVSPDYLELAIRSPVVQQQIWASVKAAAQPCLYINRIQSLLIPIAPLAEQRRIVAKVGELMALCDRLEASLARGEESRSRLLEAVLQEALGPNVEESA